MSQSCSPSMDVSINIEIEKNKLPPWVLFSEVLLIGRLPTMNLTNLKIPTPEMKGKSRLLNYIQYTKKKMQKLCLKTIISSTQQ